jgi:hypothetical protein
MYPTTSERLRSLFWQIFVAVHDEGTTRTNLTRFACANWLIVLIEKGDMHPGHGTTTGGQTLWMGEVVLHFFQMRQDHRRFGLAIELEENRTPLLYCVSKFCWAHG